MSRSKSITLWYPEYPGDYARKTAHLSMAQHGAYLLLRQHYYSTGRPLPTNVTSLYRICGALEDAEKADVRAILDEFFTLEADGYHNGRCDEELAKRSDIMEKRRAAVNSRADRRATNEPTIVDTPTPTPTPTVKEVVVVGAPGVDDFDAILLAARVDVAREGAARFYSQRPTVEKWRASGLSQSEILSVVTEVMIGKRDGPPKSLVYFDGAMARFAGQKAATPLQPIAPPEGGTTHGRRASPADPDRTQRVIDGAVARFRAGRT